MLSPPYSPHAVMMEELNQEKGKSSIADGANSVNTTKGESNSPDVERMSPIERNSPAPSNADSTNSDSANSTVAGAQSSDTSGDEFGDYDFKASLAKSRQAKRQSSEAFADDETVFDDDDVLSVKSAGSPPSATRHGSLCGRERRMTTCWDALKVNPAKYLRQERSFLELYPLRRHSWAGPGVSGISSDDQQDGGSGLNGSASGRGGNSGSSSGSSGSGVGRKRSNRAHQGFGAGRGRKRASAVDVSNDGSGDNEDGSGSSSSNSRASPSSASQVRVHDLSLNQIEDYAPPLSSLPPGKSLRAEWKGAPMDLSNDPDLHLLHPAEAHLASVLRLPCEVYLDSKRRLFAEKVHRLKQGLPFRRTDSQKACRIDVNKASRLFGAFEKIGWLQDELFTEHMP